MTGPILDPEMWAVTHGTHFAMLVGVYSTYGARVVDHLEAMPDAEVRAVLAQAIVDALLTWPEVLEDAIRWVGAQRLADRGLLYALVVAWTARRDAANG